MRNHIQNLMTKLCTLLILLLIWYFASLNINPIFIPSPIKVWGDILTLAANGSLFVNLFWTFKRIITAAILSGIVAFCLGLFIHNISFARNSLGMIIGFLRYVPVTAFYPLLIMWMGIGEEMKIAFLFIASFVYMMPTVVLALDEIPEEIVDTGRSIGMVPIQVITMIQIPSSLPGILNSFVMMIGIGWTYCAVVETINAKFGIGYVIQQASSRGKTDLVFMAIIIIMLCSFIIDTLCKYIIRRLFKWKYL